MKRRLLKVFKKKSEEEKKIRKATRREFMRKAGTIALEATFAAGGGAVLGKILEKDHARRERKKESKKQGTGLKVRIKSLRLKKIFRQKRKNQGEAGI